MMIWMALVPKKAEMCSEHLCSLPYLFLLSFLQTKYCIKHDFDPFLQDGSQLSVSNSSLQWSPFDEAQSSMCGQALYLLKIIQDYVTHWKVSRINNISELGRSEINLVKVTQSTEWTCLNSHVIYFRTFKIIV